MAQYRLLPGALRMPSWEHLLSGVSHEGVEELLSWQVQDAHGRKTSLAELVAGWCAHVIRLREDVSLGRDQASSWSKFDYIAALHLRDRLSVGVQGAPESLREIAMPVMGQADEQFRRFTEADVHGLVSRVDPGNTDPAAWW